MGSHQSQRATLVTLNGLRAIVAWVLKATLLQPDTLGKAGGMIKAHAVPVPSDSVLAPLYVGADLLDAFAIHLPAGRTTISKCWRALASSGRRGGFAR
jgi:hypothetical protein